MVPLTLHTDPLLKISSPGSKPVESGLNPGIIYISAFVAGSILTCSWPYEFHLPLSGRFNGATG